ncbi:N-acetylmuramoyl-L-alanine amidase [Palleronia aestuarii]|uniref:N-acetylmuramoyl-L-alanine amidase n=1 Tax=Palleronia aestuarii TaxID=568105 RepID=A0A2W7NGD0_9RHOB|nr:N-acetylmuramoyl-L-alanine amidase [Palleronia aestuarii]PZX18543.1 N-acetylmuramoyl-L-alanine amidase [Palleronia aestuarii]
MKRGLLAIGPWLICLSTLSAAIAEDQPDESTAWIDTEISRIADFGSDLHIELALSQAVPWQAFTLDAPRRLVLDFAEIDFAGSGLEDIVMSDVVADMRMGPVRPGWSRLVFGLSAPFQIETAGMSMKATDAAAVLKIQLAPTDEETFAELSGQLESEVFAVPETDAAASPTGTEAIVQPLRIVLDPGAPEAGSGEDRTLAFAMRLADRLRDAGMEVILTRQDAQHAGINTRAAVARAASADVLLSLRTGMEGGADAPLGAAAIYLPSPFDPEEAAVLDWTSPGAAHAADASMIRQGPLGSEETLARSQRLADALSLCLAAATGDLAGRPVTRDVNALNLPGIPSVTVDLGFLSDGVEEAELSDPLWREEAVEGIHEALVAWAREDDGVPGTLAD